MISDQHLTDQYRTPANLEARMDLHDRFSTNRYPWHRWVFDHFEFPVRCRILEIGCGSGKLWQENEERISPDWNMTLSDFSNGMLGAAQSNLGNIRERFDFRLCHVESMPFGPATFDAVVANHMLYYSRDLRKALLEIRRVLKPGGKLYASTNGLKHLKEIDDLIMQFGGGSRPISSVIETFSLENGRDWLEQYFETVRLYRQPNGLVITDTIPLVKFGLSLTRAAIDKNKRSEFAKYVELRLKENHGEMKITKDAGIFIGVKA